MDGTFSSFGDYDQCIQIEVPDKTFTGLHCIVNLHFESTKETINITQTLRVRNSLNDDHVTLLNGLCVPNVCSKDDVTLLIKDRLKDYPLTLKPDMTCVSSDETTWTSVAKNISISQIISILFLGGIVNLTTIGTLLHLIEVICQQLLEVNFGQISPAPKLTDFLVKFSFFDSFSSLFTSRKDKKQYGTTKFIYLWFTLAQIIISTVSFYLMPLGMLTICKFY